MTTKIKIIKTTDRETLRSASRIPSQQPQQVWKSNARNTVTGSGRTTSASSRSAAKHDMQPRSSKAFQPSKTIPNRHVRKGDRQEAGKLKETVERAQYAVRNKYPCVKAEDGNGTMKKRQTGRPIFNINVKIDIRFAVFLAFFVIISPIFQKYDPPPAIHATDESSAVTRQGDEGVSINCHRGCNIYLNSHR